MLAQIISYALVLHSVVPVRSAPSEGAEQETQLLFGETCVVTEEVPSWYKITNDYDGQVGWVDSQMVLKISEEEYQKYLATDRSAVVYVPMSVAYSFDADQTIPLTAASHLSNYKVRDMPDGSRLGTFEVLGRRYTIDPSTVWEHPKELNCENFREVVMPFLNIPYLWGGKNCMGLDCSGFAGVVLNIFGKSLLRNAREQATQGKEVKRLKDAQCGDLVFFNHVSKSPEYTNITHVGIILEPGKLIHCSGRVKIETITEDGIISSVTGNKTHDIAVIKRF